MKDNPLLPLYARPSDGHCNAGLRRAFSPEFYFEFDARDLVEHRKYGDGRTAGWNREIKPAFFSEF